MIKINLAGEGRRVRGAGAAAAMPMAVGAGAPANINNILLLGFVGLGLVLAGAYWFINKRILSNKQEVVAQRKAEADKLEAIIKEVEQFQRRKDSLQQRIDLINQLKQNQKGPVRIMDRISQDLPDLVWLDRMTVSGGRIALNGRGLNPNAIANFVENVKNDPYFEEPELGSMQEVTAAPLVYSFDMTFAFTYAPKSPGGAPGAPGTTTTGTTTAGRAAPAAGAAR